MLSRKKIRPIYTLVFLILITLVIFMMVDTIGHNINEELTISEMQYMETHGTEFDYYEVQKYDNWQTYSKYYSFDDESNYISKTTILRESYDDVYIMLSENLGIYDVYLEDDELHPTNEVIRDNSILPFIYYKIPDDSEGKDLYFVTHMPVKENLDFNYSFKYGATSQITMSFFEDSIINIWIALISCILSLLILILYKITKFKNSINILPNATLIFFSGLFSLSFAPFLRYIFDSWFILVYAAILVIYLIMVLMLIGIMKKAYSDFKYKRLGQIYNIALLLNVGLLIAGVAVSIYNFKFVKIIFLILLLNIILMIIGSIITYPKKNKALDTMNILVYNLFSIYVVWDSLYFYYTSYIVYIVFLIVISSLIFIRLYRILQERQMEMSSLNDSLERNERIIRHLHNSSTNNFANGKIDVLARNIAFDINNLFSDINEFFIAHVNDIGEIEILLKRGEKNKEEEYKQLVISSYNNIKEDSFEAKVEGGELISTFKVNTYEILFLYIHKEYDFEDIDKIVIGILLPSISNAYNSTKVYSGFMQIQEELILVFGRILNIRSGNKNNVEGLSRYAELLAETIGYSEEDIYFFKLAACIYNMGKLGLLYSLSDRSKINSDQLDYHMEHITLGYEMLSRLSGKLMYIASFCSLDHHEFYNGKGYLGKKDEEISEYGRMICVVNAFDRFICKTQKEEKFTIDEAIKYITLLAGNELDPYMVNSFVHDKNKIIDIYKEVY